MYIIYINIQILYTMKSVFIYKIQRDKNNDMNVYEYGMH